MCGASKTTERSEDNGPGMSPEEEAAAAAKFLDEERFWKRCVWRFNYRL